MYDRDPPIPKTDIRVAAEPNSLFLNATASSPAFAAARKSSSAGVIATSVR